MLQDVTRGAETIGSQGTEAVEAVEAFGYWLAGGGARSMMAVEQGARADAAGKWGH